MPSRRGLADHKNFSSFSFPKLVPLSRSLFPIYRLLAYPLCVLWLPHTSMRNLWKSGE